MTCRLPVQGTGVLAVQGKLVDHQFRVQGFLRNEDLVVVRVGDGSNGGGGEWRTDNSRLGLVVSSDMSPEQRSPTVTFNINLKSYASGRASVPSFHNSVLHASSACPSPVYPVCCVPVQKAHVNWQLVLLARNVLLDHSTVFWCSLVQASYANDAHGCNGHGNV